MGPRRAWIWGAAAILIVATTRPCRAEGLRIPPGLWDVVSLERVPGSSEPERRHVRECVRKGSFEAIYPIPRGCVVTRRATSAATRTWRLACGKATEAATGIAEMTVTDDRAHGGARVESRNGTTESAWSATRLGPCEEPAVETSSSQAPAKPPGTRPLHAR